MTRVLLSYLFKTAAALIPAAAILAYLVFGESVALGLFAGALVALISGAGLIWLVGQLLEPNSKRSKGLLFTILFGKLILVAGLLWLAFAVLQLSELGIVCGIGVALVSLVVGVNRGSSSAAGQKAMAEDEARIQQEMGDNDAESS